MLVLSNTWFPSEQISDFTGSGPFVFKRDEWKPGDKTVYIKNAQYKPRGEPASGLAGGKVVKVDRVEWRALSDQQTIISALLAGEIDYVETPSHDLLPVLKKDSNVKLADLNPLGNQYTFRYNTLFKPFDNAKIRQAVMVAFNQKDSRRSSATPPTTRSARRSSPAGRPIRPPRGWRAFSTQTRRRPRRC